MQANNPEREPATTAELVTLAIFLSIVIGLFIAEVIQDYEPVKLSVLFIVLFWMVLMVLHEAGHAVAAALFGWRVYQIVLGMGKTLGQFRIGRAKVELRMFPLEGFVTTVPSNLHRPQLKEGLIYAAGPAMDLIAALVVLLAFGSEKLFTRTDDIEMIAWQSFAIAGVFQGVVNLIPQWVDTPMGRVANDGMGIIWCFSTPTIAYAEMINQAQSDDEDADGDDWKDPKA